MSVHPLHTHLGRDEVAGNGSRGRVFLLPGSAGRARQLAERLEGAREVGNPRGHTAFLGTLRRGALAVDVGVVATGMGCPSVNIIVTELIAMGASRLLRVGTSGTLQPAVRVGDLVIATGAVRDESTSDAFVPREVPAVAHPDWVAALRRAALELGHGARTFAGLVHTKDAFYGREFAMGPQSEAQRRYMEVLASAGVLASEMEASHLFVLGAVHGAGPRPLVDPVADGAVVKAGALLAVIGDLQGFGAPEARARAEAAACDTAMAAAAGLIGAEG